MNVPLMLRREKLSFLNQLKKLSSMSSGSKVLGYHEEEQKLLQVCDVVVCEMEALEEVHSFFKSCEDHILGISENSKRYLSVERRLSVIQFKGRGNIVSLALEAAVSHCDLIKIGEESI